MPMTDTMSTPAVVLLSLVVLVLLVWVFRGLGGSGRKRDKAQVIAAVQAERDVLRANHAVEIATLEGRLADAQARAQSQAEATMRLKTMEQTLATLRKELEASEAARTTAEERVAALSAEQESVAERLRNVPQLVSERDRARSQIAERDETIDGLRRELHEANASLSRAASARADQGASIVTLTTERDDALARANHAEGLADGLHRDMQQLRDRLGDARRELEEIKAASGDVGSLRDREEKLRRTLKEREDTIAELRQSMKTSEPIADVSEVGRLSQALEVAEAREKSAHESLSRLAYECDGLKNRLIAAERVERESKADVEKREAVLELRLQKIHDLEAKLREQHGQLVETQRRATLAESRLASQAETGEIDPNAVNVTAAEANERVERLQRKLDQVREENGALMGELEALRLAATQGEGEEGGAEAAITALTEQLDAARTRIDALTSENASLSAAASEAGSASAAEIASLKEELRKLADRFMAGEAEEPAEPSLADRIRAFKAARATQQGA
ncbi:coiled-coil domain-containing protein [Acuticoccus mangrovi]|uniref:Uncharacterized protein n=1 Tax=Acuticoccus mangrovi TaxID=2796142 RepID=A0A934MFQ0_9HYPH|nr:hypothetical protein [Acuticoccus mangrovi]MBJ3775165.1 hypothetical protein [Acuticoccus mangrovi]